MCMSTKTLQSLPFELLNGIFGTSPVKWYTTSTVQWQGTTAWTTSLGRCLASGQTTHGAQQHECFTEPIRQWLGQTPVSSTYQFLTASARSAAAVNVVNDGAERAIKLATDFVEVAPSDEHFQNVLQVVEKDRKDNPNLRRTRHSSDYRTVFLCQWLCQWQH